MPHEVLWVPSCLNATCEPDKHVDLDNRVFYLSPDDQKNGLFDTVTMTHCAFEVATRRLKMTARRKSKKFEDNPKLYLFPWEYPRKALQSACERAGVESSNLHCLRHTFASWMVQRGVPLREVQQLMRHESVTTTENYAHLAPSAEAHYLHSTAYRPGQGLLIIDQILQKQVLTE